MDDTVYRQAAIDALGEKPLAWTEGEYELGLQNQWQSDIDALKALPPAQSERKKGKWINDRDLYKCSCCNQLWNVWWAGVVPIEQMKKEMPYCPKCGADMRGEEDE